MVIVIDLSSKLVGYNLFENFFYQLKNEGTLVFANNPLTVDDIGWDYNDLRSNVQNLLYDRHAASYSLCVLYDMNLQKDDPIRNSIAATIRDINHNIIRPLSQDYSLDRLYFFNLDDIRRNYDGFPKESNIVTAIDYDSLGYVRSEEAATEFNDILFTEDEIQKLDLKWFDLRNRNLTADRISIVDAKSVSSEFKSLLNTMFEGKFKAIEKEYSDLDWYATRLKRVLKTVDSAFENALYRNANSIHSLQAPSELLRQSLKNEISTYHERDAIILHVHLTDKNVSMNTEILKFRSQLEIIALLIYLATNDTKMVFNGGKTIGQENHWEVKTILSDEMLAKMLASYNSKLKVELDKLGKFTSNEIEYEEFSPRTFNLSMEMKKPELPPTPEFGLFCDKHDLRKLELFADKLYSRYVQGVAYSNKRIRELTTKLRVQKESDSSGKVKKGNLLEISAELNKWQTAIKELQHKIAFYRPRETATVNEELKTEYADTAKQIQAMMIRRVKTTTFAKILFLIICVALISYPVMQLIDFPQNAAVAMVIFMSILPAGAYTLIQMAYLALLRKKINKKINAMVKKNEALVGELFRNDNEASKYVQDVYYLIMLKKYVNECNAKVIASNRKFKQFNYHQEQLKQHAAISDRLIQILGIKNTNIPLLPIDKIEGLEGGKGIEATPMYCPLNYLSLADSIKVQAVVNDQQHVDVNGNLVGFVDKFTFEHDKEYRHD